MTSSWRRSDYLVIIPTYNESENIESLVHEILAQEASPDILVVDDNSPDGTGEVADRLSRELGGKLRVIHRPAKLGIGSAHLRGFQHALESGYCYIISMDADFSHHPRYIAGMAEKAGCFDVIIGSRYIPGGSTRNWGLFRRLNSRAANFLAKRVLRLEANDCTAGFRLYRAEALRSINFSEVYSEGYSFLMELLYRLSLKGVTVAEIPIVFENRRAGASKISRNEIFKAVKFLIRYWLKPLRRDFSRRA